MGIIDIEYLCKLDRLRDSYIDGLGNKKIVQIENKTKRTKEETTYRTIIINDNGLVKNEGIVDSMIRMTFELKKINDKEHSPGEYQGKRVVFGAYLRYKIVKKKESAWDTYFRTCQKVYFNEFKNEICKNDFEGYMSEGVLKGIELLCDLVDGKFNNRIREIFDIEINSVEDFKNILKDENLSKGICNYLISAVKNDAKSLAYYGKNPIWCTYKNKNSQELKYFSYIYLDKPVKKDSDEIGYDFMGLTEEESYDKELDKIDEIIEVKDIEKKEDGIYNFIIQNKNKILTERQIEYIEDYIDGVEKNRIFNFDKFIASRILDYLHNHRNCFKKSWGYVYNGDILNILECILTKNTLKSSYIELINSLNNCNSKVETILLDGIHSLDCIHYKHITKSITKDIYSKYYIDNYFIEVVEELQRIYNFYSNSNKSIYNFSKSENELKMSTFKKWVDKNILGDKLESRVLSVQNDKSELYSKDEISEIYNKIFNSNMNYINFKKYMNECGYYISNKITITVENKKLYCYKIMKIENISELKKHTKQIKKTNSKKLELKVDDKIIDELRSLIEENLVKGFVVMTNDDIGYMKYATIKDFLMNKLNIKVSNRLKTDDVIMLCEKAGYKMHNRTSKKISDKSYNIRKLERLR